MKTKPIKTTGDDVAAFLDKHGITAPCVRYGTLAPTR